MSAKTFGIVDGSYRAFVLCIQHHLDIELYLVLIKPALPILRIWLVVLQVTLSEISTVALTRMLILYTDKED